MKENHFSLLNKLHLALMALLIPMNLITGGMQLFNVLPATPSEWKILVMISALTNLINIAALISGISYLMQRYQKTAVNLYKTMLILTAVSSSFYLSSGLGLINTGSSSELDLLGSNTTFLIAAVLMMVKIVMLLGLIFLPDLGKRRTWILFTVILIADLAYGFLFSTAAGTAFSRITNVLSRLLMDGTIGLAIKGKYDDKDARGTV